MKLGQVYRLLTLLIPVVHATFSVKMLAFNTIRDSVEVRGKGSSDGDIRTLGVDGEETDIKSYCFMDETYIGWTTNCVGSKPTFSEVTTITFDEPTIDPRQLNITTPEHKLMVRQPSAPVGSG
jgi:hypothetical protein